MGHDFLEGLGVPRGLKGYNRYLEGQELIEEIMIFSFLKYDTENITQITGFFEIASNF